MSWSINTGELTSHWCDGQLRVEVQKKNDGPTKTNSIDVSSAKKSNLTQLDFFNPLLGGSSHLVSG